MINIQVPPKEKIIKTSEDDSGPERYYAQSSFIRKIYKDRLQIAIDLVGERKYKRLLEIGYGNGMLFPTFSHFANELHGIDIHGQESKVTSFFPGNFIHGSVYDIPFAKDHFDCIFCLSVIEHLDNLDTVFKEINRVTAKEADIIFGIPSDNIFMKLFFWLKKSPAVHTHINGRKELLRLIVSNFNIIDKSVLRICGINVYTAVKCRQK